MPFSGAIQRRGGGGGTGSALPMTSADAALSSPGKSSTHRRRRGRGAKSNRILLGQVIVISAIALAMVLIHRHRSSTNGGEAAAGGAEDDSSAKRPPPRPRRRVETSDGAPLPLAEFSSLSYALANADLVALYFAAAWCPMSTPVTEELESAFPRGAGTLLVPGDGASGEDTVSRRPLAIVYVSSDKSDEEMRKYSRDGWFDVPFGSPDRNGLKRRFRVCAKRELRELGFDRKMEIPTLIVIDSVTQGVLTTSGVNDLKEYGDKAIDHWLGLQKLVRALEDKYEDEERERERERRPEPRIV